MRYLTNSNHWLESGASDSDVGASTATVTLINKNASINEPYIVALACPPNPDDCSDHRLYRLAFDNACLNLLETQSHIYNHIIQEC